MLKKIFILVLLFSFNQVNAQSSDFILLKKKNKTIASYYSGTNIAFITKSGVYKNASIKKIIHDSIFLKEYIVTQNMTQFGFYVLDTAGSFNFVYHINDIASIVSSKNNFDVKASGAGLLGGGILLTLASGVVYFADREKFSPQLMIAGAGLGALGYLMTNTGNKGIVIGKRKYRLEYIRANN